MNPFGLNVLSQPHIDRDTLLAWVKRAAPTLTVVMDAPELAQQIRAASPKTLVVHRTYHQADSRWHEVVTPKKFLDAHAPTAANGVVCQVFNEPSGAAVFAATTWIEQLIAQCPPTILTLAQLQTNTGYSYAQWEKILDAIQDEVTGTADPYDLIESTSWSYYAGLLRTAFTVPYVAP